MAGLRLLLFESLFDNLYPSCAPNCLTFLQFAFAVVDITLISLMRTFFPSEYRCYWG
jgi:hypothetical protein